MGVTVDVTVRIAGLVLRNPVILASGTFGYGAEYTGWMDFSRVGGVVTKTITMLPRAGNPPPRTVETAAGMLNSIGLQNPGLDEFVARQEPALRDLPTAVFVSIAGTSVEEFAEMARRLDGLPGVDALELNVSSPNMKDGGMLFGVSPTAVREVTAAVKRVTRSPVAVKLSPNVTDIVSIAKAAEEGGADAVSLINTLLGMAVDSRTRRPLLGNLTGGLSGPAIKPVALAMTWRVAQRVGIPVVGMGGIRTAEDALEFLIVGARAVQVGTATFVDPTCALDIAEGIRTYCGEAGVKSVGEIVGTLRRD